MLCVKDLPVNWEAIGAIGEVLGAVGVILTLAYLAYQIRQNTIATRLETTSNFQNGFAAVELMIASNAEFAEVLAKGRNGEELTPPEFVRLQAFYRTVLRAWQTNISQYEAGGLEEETWQGTKALMSQTFQEDRSLLKHWKQNRSQFNTEFNSLVESLLEVNAR